MLGATGCLGRRISAELSARGDEIIAVARRGAASDTACRRFVVMEVGRDSGPALADLFDLERVDAVVNATAGWGRTEQEAHEGNAGPVEGLLDALRRLSPGPRVVHLGTVHEYGPVAEGTLIREDTEARPESVYARAKLLASQSVLDAVRDGTARGVVVRLANTYGPDPAPGGFLGALTARLRALDPAATLDLTIADAKRDYVDVRDAAEAIALAVHTPAADPLVNIGRGEAVDMRALVQALLRAGSLPIGAVREQAGTVTSLGGDWTCVDTARAAKLLDWRPRYGLDESMRAMWDSLLVSSSA